MIKSNAQTGNIEARTFMATGADTDIVVSSARAYVAAINRMIAYTKSSAAAENVGGGGGEPAAAEADYAAADGGVGGGSAAARGRDLSSRVSVSSRCHEGNVLICTRASRRSPNRSGRGADGVEDIHVDGEGRSFRGGSRLVRSRHARLAVRRKS